MEAERKIKASWLQALKSPGTCPGLSLLIFGRGYSLSLLLRLYRRELALQVVVHDGADAGV